ncbi:LAMI_0B04038g1_1 [Lachancea mirantina]|uniref:LAMI_0B04038g1_1 n=1 Tax=Lachancea mirantina TaxID=1230905 RepID=A0A1G4IV72_9SACH|nr:LAMI_0B04038g1_1 [Lachancea mirantina]
MYSDSYFQSHHLRRAHDVLYADWTHDSFLPPHHLALAASNAAVAGSFWDGFHDDDDWGLFHSLQLDCTGQLTAVPPLVSTPTPLGSVFAPARAATRLPVWDDFGGDELAHELSMTS